MSTDRLSAEGGRIARRFARLRDEGRAGLITFITAGDPDFETCATLLEGLPAAGADLIELGVPFSDPMADGPAIQAASLRALNTGMTSRRTLELVRRFRATDDEIPIILMGYYNPVYAYGVERFLADAVDAGVDGLIIVDLPPEEDAELCIPAMKAGVNFIRLATPTTDAARLPAVLRNTSGFVYYVSIAGVTGTATADDTAVATAVDLLKARTDLPVAVGFGIKTPDQAAAIARVADAAVVGSAIVNRLADGLDGEGKPRAGLVKDVLSFVGELASGVRAARNPAH